MRDEAREAIALPNRKSKSYIGLSIARLMRKKVGVACMTVIVIMYGSGIFSPLVAPYGYNDQDLSQVKQRPSLSHPFGTDRLGRDVLTRIIYGLRTTVIITITVVCWPTC